MMRMKDYLSDGVNCGQDYRRRKTSLGTKVAVGTAAAGTAAYLGVRRIWSHFYPPTFKKYFAMAVMASALLCIKNCGTVSNKLDAAYHGVSKSISLRIERAPQMKSLEARIDELVAENNSLRQQSQEARESMEKKGYALKADLEKQIGSKGSVLADAKKYIISLEREYFNYKASTKADPKKPGKLIQLSAPSKEAFQDFLLHKKDYNAMTYKIDKEIIEK
jgi:hypothetical protein